MMHLASLSTLPVIGAWVAWMPHASHDPFNFSDNSSPELFLLHYYMARMMHLQCKR